jgi:hypothetical protein
MANIQKLYSGKKLINGKQIAVPKGKSKKSVEQPRKHASKSPLAAKIRRDRLVKAVLNGECLKDVAIATGLSPKTASSQATAILKHPEAQKTFNMIMEESGLTDKILAGKIRDLINAKQTIFFQKDGTVIDSRKVEALETQRKTLELAVRLKGHLKEKAEIDLRVGIMALVVDALNADNQG